VEAATLSAGLSLSWLETSFAHLQGFEALNTEAAVVPAGSEGLFFLPYLALTRKRVPSFMDSLSDITAGI
jgi:sugar (pentulose or hexulose) kinase